MKQRFHKITYIVLSSFLLLFFSVSGYSQEKMVNNSKELVEFSQKSLANYVNNILNEKNYANFGFKSLKESQKATLGAPYKVVTIGLKSLKDYKVGANIKDLLVDSNTMWFPVMVDNEVRTKLEIIEKNGAFIAGEFGGIKTVRKVTAVQSQLSGLIESEKIRGSYTVKLVKIPVLFASFLYVESGQKGYLIPAMVQPQRFKLQEGKMYGVDDVLSILKEYAEKIDENMIR